MMMPTLYFGFFFSLYDACTWAGLSTFYWQRWRVHDRLVKQWLSLHELCIFLCYTMAVWITTIITAVITWGVSLCTFHVCHNKCSVCVCACVRVCMFAYVCVCVCVCILKQGSLKAVSIEQEHLKASSLKHGSLKAVIVEQGHLKSKQFKTMQFKGSSVLQRLQNQCPKV